MKIQTKRINISTSELVEMKAKELSTEIFGKPNISPYFAFLVTEKYNEFESRKK